MAQVSGVEILDAGAALRITWADGVSARFHAIWLRDNAPDELTRDPVSGQRLITVQQVACDTRIADVERAMDAISVQLMPDDRRFTFSLPWLRERIYDRVRSTVPGCVPEGVELWTADSLDQVPDASLAELAGHASTLRHWLRSLCKFGVARTSGGPIETGALLQVVGLFGFVRETNYGRWFEVRTEVSPSNLAYSSLGLQRHTDNPYRDPVPTLQVLYCLENSARGGDNQVVDGFKAAQRLREANPQGFELLSTFPARFEYRGKGDVYLQAQRPMIELSQDGTLRCIRFNNRSTAANVDVPYEHMPGYYRAYRQFAGIIDDPAMAVSFKLQPGESFVVDNTRVLHGRTAYAGDGGKRWLQGCYADKDALLSTLSILETQARTAEKVID